MKAAKWQKIFNGQAAHEKAQRFHGRGDWSIGAEATLAKKLRSWGALACTDGSEKEVNACHGLRSLPCGPASLTTDEAASLGAQPAHADAERAPGLSHLKPQNKPFSALIAIQSGTLLWIFPSGCENPEDRFLVRLDVGDVLLFQGDVVHAGAGYACEHYRIHAYVDPPVRAAQTARCLPFCECL